MSRYHSYLNSATQVINKYRGEEPFASFIKKYFAEHKKYGANDRKQIAHLCYCYFRMGMSFPEMPVEEKILAGLFLCSTTDNPVLQQMKPEWNQKIHLDFGHKSSMIVNPGSAGVMLHLLANLFPYTSELTEGIEQDEFVLSHLRQPRVFIRLRPGHEITVKKKLQEAAIEFSPVSDTCLALSNSASIDKVVELNKEAVVQDYSSQRTAELLFNLKSKISKSKFTVWDCCAASGGKSIMIHDLYPNIHLTVSDIRDSILHNLKKRFQEAGIKKYHIFKTDLTNPHSLSPRAERSGTTHNPIAIGSPYDLLICDVPCSGSGTWGRTPEQLSYFEKNKIGHYAAIQKRIVANVLKHLKPGGHLVYITCSVFKKENEEIVDYMRKNLRLELIQAKLLKGYNINADTMFTALLRKQL
jgi:16S rRNA (cytosine967-C5)-methyltransferase